MNEMKKIIAMTEMGKKNVGSPLVKSAKRGRGLFFWLERMLADKALAG